MTQNTSLQSLVWLRRDLRLYDHAALFHSLKQAGNIQPVFIFDTDVLSRFSNPEDRRLSFIAKRLCWLNGELKKRGGGLLVLHGSAKELIPKLVEQLNIANVFAAEDYEPSAIDRDKHVAKVIDDKLKLVKDQVVFAPSEILKADATPFKVYTPYSKAWRAALSPASFAPYEINDKGRYADIVQLRKALSQAGLNILDPAVGAKSMLAETGYREVFMPLWPVAQVRERLGKFVSAKVGHYPEKRDIPGEEGTSRLSPYLRFGLISVRECYRLAEETGSADKWINELIWREFYAMILYHYPESTTMEWNLNYRGTLDWRQDEALLAAWTEGMTGYPLVDAAMRELKTTGWMHNRSRMVVASFLTKDMLLDWRLGEAHFAQLLMDYDMASNVGGWQWAASTGTDAQPWFRIFNPTLQSKKFDPQGTYIKRYVPELKDMPADKIHEPWKFCKPADYPAPIIDHAEMRKQALAMFKAATS